MIAALRAEFRKLLTVRTTLFITAFVVVVIFLVAFFLEGMKLKTGELHNPYQLASSVTGALNVTVLGAVVAILLMTHEYRYNTIMYTLTSSNSRNKVLAAKFVVVSTYALVLTLFVAVFSPLMTILGVHAAGHTMVPQILHIGSLAWRCLFYGWAYGMIGLLLAILTRNQVAAIVALFLIPSLVEQLLSFFWLKHNSVYLPFNALSQVINGPGPAGSPTSSNMSAGHAALVVLVYLVVGWIVGWLLFLKRDAN